MTALALMPVFQPAWLAVARPIFNGANAWLLQFRCIAKHKTRTQLQLRLSVEDECNIP